MRLLGGSDFGRLTKVLSNAFPACWVLVVGHGLLVTFQACEFGGRRAWVVGFSPPQFTAHPWAGLAPRHPWRCYEKPTTQSLLLTSGYSDLYCQDQTEKHLRPCSSSDKI